MPHHYGKQLIMRNVNAMCVHTSGMPSQAQADYHADCLSEGAATSRAAASRTRVLDDPQPHPMPMELYVQGRTSKVCNMGVRIMMYVRTRRTRLAKYS